MTYESNLFPDRDHAERALGRLEQIGYGPENISLILSEADLPADQNFASDTSPLAVAGGMGGVGVAVGAVSGGVLGAIVAAAVSSALIIVSEGAALEVVAGPLVAALGGFGAGVSSGAIVGGLLELGIEAQDWHEALRNGGVAIVVGLKSNADRKRVRDALFA